MSRTINPLYTYTAGSCYSLFMSDKHGVRTEVDEVICDIPNKKVRIVGYGTLSIESFLKSGNYILILIHRDIEKEDLDGEGFMGFTARHQKTFGLIFKFQRSR